MTAEKYLPESTVPGLIPTQNNCGYMALKLDKFSTEFVNSLNNASIALEVGAAYGYATLQALQQGATVYANDIEEKHLEILANRATEHGTKLKTIVGAMPNIEFPHNFFDAILVCRILHFLSGRDVELSIKKILNWLKSGAKLYLVGDTPYLGLWAKKFATEFEKRKQAGQNWPSVMEPFAKYLSTDADLSVAPRFLNPFDLSQAVDLCLNAGFTIESAAYIDRKNDFPPNFCYDGRESAGVIAVKTSLL